MSERAREDRRLTRGIETIFGQHRTRYGSPRIHRGLRREGIHVGRKRVERLMRDAGLRARCSRIYRRSPGTTRFFERHRNLRVGSEAPTGPDRLWVADLTFLRVGPDWRYLAVVLDGYSRRVLGWSLGQRRTAELTREALRHALRHRRPAPGLIFHTDRGTEYGGYLLQSELRRHGMRSSMNRPGRCTDNAHMESFFHTLKAEVIHGVRFASVQALRGVLNQYMGRYYNHRRMHSALGYCSPVEYEALSA
jgi:transposase InsO family protein